MHRLSIRNLGSVDECEIICRPFMVMTGEQASGKSTVAKALYYFRTVKDDMFDAVRDKFIKKPARIPLALPMWMKCAALLFSPFFFYKNNTFQMGVLSKIRTDK